MGLTMKEKQAVTRELALEYKRATKKRKGEILDSLVQLTEYNRSYAARVLRQRARRVVVGSGRAGDVNVVLVEDQRPLRKKRRNRPRTYSNEVVVPLQKVWVICDGICSKRLAPYLAEIVPKLEQLGELTLDDEVRRKLLRISPATVDRLLAPVRKRYELRARSQTKPGTLIKHQIPIRTFSDWDEARPGFVEIDLVSHEGRNPRGDYAYTLDATDICTGWTETEAVRNRAERWVFAGLEKTLTRFPFDIREIDSDNGSEFINNHLIRYCTENEITFTRSRPYRKNDNCFVEQKNDSIVRRAVGYGRYDTAEELDLLDQLYSRLRLYTNFFQPVMKLVEKTRTGSRVTKRYDRATTPFGRVLESRRIPRQTKAQLQRDYAALNPVTLGREISRLENKLHAAVQQRTEERSQATLKYIST
jgi:hypothetical protein